MNKISKATHGWWAAVVLVVGILVAFGMLMMLGTASLVDERLADESGIHAAGSVRTRDVQPGDEVYVQTWATGRKGQVQYANGKLVVDRGAKELHNIRVGDGGEDLTASGRHRLW